jgi:hypothetical protein
MSALLRWRYGATGLGLVDTAEHGLSAAEAEEIQAWADERFTAANAVVLLTCRPPADLRLDLLAGRAHGDAESQPVPEQRFPTIFPAASAVVAVSGIQPRGSTSAPVRRHVNRRLTRRLRTELGITYSVQVSDLRVDRSADHVIFAADALPAHASEVAATMVEELGRITEQGVDADALARDVQHFHRVAQSRDAVLGLLAGRARAQLHQEQWSTTVEAAERLLSLQGVEVAAGAEAIRASSMWLLPRTADPPDMYFHEPVEWSAARVEGERFQLNQDPVGDQPRSLIVGDDGVTEVRAGGRFLTVRWTDCVGMLWWTTGERLLYGRDGTRVGVDPARWERARAALAAIDAHVGVDLLVPMGENEDTTPSGVRPPRFRRRPSRATVLARLAAVAAVLALGTWGTALSREVPPTTGPRGVQVDPITHQITFGDATVIPGGRSVDLGGVVYASVFTSAALGLGAAALVHHRRRNDVPGPTIQPAAD